MKAQAESLTFIGAEEKLTIPFFQRSYVWNDKNWDGLLSDLLNFKHNHFLGSLILKEQSRIPGQAKEMLVIDGQQRLTTLSILIKALFDLFSPDLQDNARNSIHTYLFYKTKQTDKHFQIKLNHSHIDAPEYRHVITGIDLHLPEHLAQITDKSSLIRQCYKFFVKFLTQETEETRENLFNSLLADANKILVVVALGPHDNEQAIFDTINTAGARLSSADIIKNSLFQRVLQLLKHEPQMSEETRLQYAVALYDSTWKTAFIQNDDTVRFWDMERATGRLMRDNIEILLHCYATIHKFYDPEKNTLSELSELFKARIENSETLPQVEQMIRGICEYAGIYREYIASFDATSLLGYDDPLYRLLHILDALQITTFHPFLLFVIKNYDSNADKQQIFRKLECFIVRRMIAGADTKNYNKMCKDLLENPLKLDDYAADQTDQKILSGIRRIDNKSAKLLLFWIELFRRRNDSKFDAKHLKYTYTLEHLMPQKWEEYWTTVPAKTNPDGTAMSLEQAKRDRYEKVYYLGNMTLLTTQLNTALRNFEFMKKVEGEGRRKGIKHYASLSVTRHDILDPYEAGDKVWDEAKILKRTEQLEKEILAIWQPPSKVV